MKGSASSMAASTHSWASTSSSSVMPPAGVSRNTRRTGRLRVPATSTVTRSRPCLLASGSSTSMSLSSLFTCMSPYKQRKRGKSHFLLHSSGSNGGVESHTVAASSLEAHRMDASTSHPIVLGFIRKSMRQNPPGRFCLIVSQGSDPLAQESERGGVTGARFLARTRLHAKSCGLVTETATTGAHCLAEAPRIAVWWPEARPQMHISWQNRE